MRHLRTLGLTAIAAAMALVGATSASALKPTQLCKVHTSLTCPGGEGTSAVHMTLAEGTVGKLLSSLVNVLCLTVLAESTPLALGKPQNVHTLSSEYSGCGSSSTHNNCTVTVEEQPLGTLLKTGLDVGSLELTSGRERLVCGNLGIDCKYDNETTLFEVGAQHLTASETPTIELGGKFFCPGEGKLDGLLTTLHSPSSSGLCKTHSSETCAEKDRVISLHVVTTKPAILYNTIANIECASSLGTATVSAPAELQKLEGIELTWQECHTQGAADNCTLSSEAASTSDLHWTSLNVGTATILGLEVTIDCLILDLIELDCVYGSDVTLQAEGALHKEGSGNGMFTASKAVLKKLEGSGHCPESVKWDALYEPLEHVYILGSPPGGEAAFILG